MIGDHVTEPNGKDYYITHYYNLPVYVSLSFDLYYCIDCWGYLSILSGVCKGLQVGTLNLVMAQLRFINDSSPLLFCQLTILQGGHWLCQLVQVNQMKDITDKPFMLVHSKWVMKVLAVHFLHSWQCLRIIVMAIIIWRHICLVMCSLNKHNFHMSCH